MQPASREENMVEQGWYRERGHIIIVIREQGSMEAEWSTSGTKRKHRSEAGRYPYNTES